MFSIFLFLYSCSHHVESAGVMVSPALRKLCVLLQSQLLASASKPLNFPLPQKQAA